MIGFHHLFVGAILVLTQAHGFIQTRSFSPRSLPTLSSTATSVQETPLEIGSGDEQNPKGLLKRDRYVATNRFAVRPGKEAKFEKRWATRKSKLATLDGFRYFHLMRRVTLEEENETTYNAGDKSDSSNMGNYVSFTIWEKKSHFSAWRNGEAFKEAHGGTSIGAFLSTMINSALVLKGPPRPAFYDGLLLQSVTPESVPETVDGWRDVNADGESILPAECFIAMNQFYIPSDNGQAFEQRWANRESKLKQYDGFVAFSMLRRDGTAKGHGTSPMSVDEPTYASVTIWKDRESFENWRSDFNKNSHGSSGNDSKPSESKNEKPQWSRPPSPVFYEGTLVITSTQGA